MDKEKKELYEKTLEKILETELVILEDKKAALEVIEAVKNNKMSMNIFSKYPEILNIKPNKVRNVINAFIDSNLPLSILEKEPEIIEKTNATRVSNNAKLFLDQDLPFSILEKFTDIIAIGNDDNMRKILKVFDDRIINRKFFTNAGDVLALANAEDLEKIMELLDEEDLLNIVLKSEPSVLYSNSARVIKQIIDLFKDPKEKLGIQLIRQNLKLLSQTTKVRMVAILNVLERAGISRIAVKLSPDILYSNETKVIEGHISDLRSRGIKKETIAKIPEILTKETLTKELEIIEYINDNENIFFDILEKYPKVILEADLTNLEEFKTYIEKEMLPGNLLSIAPEVLIKNTPSNVEEILDNLKEINEEEYYKEFPTILNLQNPQNIIKIAKVFEELNLPKSIYQTSVSVFVEGDVQNIKDIVGEIDQKQIGREILENSFILARGNPENITKIIDKFESSENIQLGTQLLKKSGTILAQGDASKIDDITKLLEDYGFIEEGSNIPASIYAKGNPIQMKEIYEYMNGIGLLPGLKSSMTLFIRPIDNIKENVNLLIEHGLFEDFYDNVSVLGLSPQTVEKRIIYLEAVGEKPTIPILKLNNTDFYNQYGINERDMERVKEKPLSQTIIENKYANHISNDAKFLNLEGLKAVNEIYNQIEELGIVNKNLEYTKKGYSYSLIKIKENIHKIVSNISDYSNISFIEMTDIYTMAILGNKKVDEKEINEIRESIKIREIEIENETHQQILDMPKVAIVDEEERIEETELVEEETIEDIFDDPDTVDGVDIDDIESIDDFDRFSGIRKERLVFPEDEEDIDDNRIENQIELDLDNEFEEVADHTENSDDKNEKEAMISEMRREIEEMNKTLQEILLRKEEEKLEQQRKELAEKIKAELEEEAKEAEKEFRIQEKDEVEEILETKEESTEELKEEIIEEKEPKYRGIKLIDDESEELPIAEEIKIEPDEEIEEIEQLEEVVEVEDSKIYEELTIEEEKEEKIIDIEAIKEDDRVKIAADTLISDEEEYGGEPKVFFGLDDYGHFAKYTESDDLTKLQIKLNEMYKQKRIEED